MTKLTVLLPVYNGMPHLSTAVESILTQSLKHFRLLVIDDGSTDETAAYLDSIRDSRVEIVRQQNEGSGAARNRGIALCDTEYVALMDADDLSHPGRLEAQLRYLDSHRDVVIVGSRVRFLAGGREFRGPRKPVAHDDIRSGLLRGRATLCHAACMFRASAVSQTGGYHIQGVGEDMDFLLRISEVGRAANLDSVLYTIRIHRTSVNWTSQDRVVLGRAYAVECARRRQAGDPEPTISEFEEYWRQRPVFRRALDALDVWSVRQYRNALLDLGEARMGQGICRLACAAACRPGAVWHRVCGFLSIRRFARQAP